ncbi:MAG: hypothetical protein CEE38_15385 [Planctomycetes bacterium B3_Pla]|nr:MAG: hypothetical protein CEE38_15385 [Planctomycetes bacterium B3_Pla]
MMSWGLKTRGLRPIGLDIGHNSIKMIQLLMNEEQISVLAADEVRTPEGIIDDEQARNKFVISAIRQMLDRGNFDGRNVISCLPNGKLRITSLRLAEVETDEIEQALRKEVVQRFGLDPDKDAMDYVVAGNVRQGNEVKSELILLATDNETLKGHIETLECAGLRPVAIDTIPCALFRSFERSLRRREDRDRTAVFVDVGSSFTTVVFGPEGKISFVKQIPIGGQNFVQEVAAKLGINTSEAESLRGMLRTQKDSRTQKSDSTKDKCAEKRQKLDVSTQQVIVDAISAVAEDLAREISLCLRYYTVTFRGKRMERAVFAGGGAYEDILLDVLRRQLTVKVEVAEPLRGFDLSSERARVHFDSDREGLLCEWAVAVGLSLKGWNEAKDDNCQAKKQVTGQL